MMDANIKTQWLKALKSGEFNKGRYALKKTSIARGTNYCCLGVLAEITGHSTDEEMFSGSILERPLCWYEHLSDLLTPEHQFELIRLNDRNVSYGPSIKYIEEIL